MRAPHILGKDIKKNNWFLDKIDKKGAYETKSFKIRVMLHLTTENHHLKYFTLK